MGGRRVEIASVGLSGSGQLGHIPDTVVEGFGVKLRVRFCSPMSILHLCLFIFTCILRLGVMIGRLCSLLVAYWRCLVLDLVCVAIHTFALPCFLTVVLAPRLHGIVVVDDGNSGDALLRHFFTGFCALARDCRILSMSL